MAMLTAFHSIIFPYSSSHDVPWFGFPFILLGILRIKRKKKKEKERGLVSSLHPLNSLPLVVVAFAKKSLAR